MNSYFLTTQQANKANFASAPSYDDRLLGAKLGSELGAIKRPLYSIGAGSAGALIGAGLDGYNNTSTSSLTGALTGGSLGAMLGPAIDTAKGYSKGLSGLTSNINIRQQALAEEAAVARANNKRIASIKDTVAGYGDELLDSVGDIADDATEFIKDGADDVVDAVRGLPKPSARNIGLAAGGLGLAGAGAGLGGYLANRNKQSDMSRYMGNPVASFKRGVYREASFNKFPEIPDPWDDIRASADNVLDRGKEITANAPKVVMNKARNIKQTLSKTVPKGRGMQLGGVLGAGLAGLGAYKLLGNQKQYEG